MYIVVQDKVLLDPVYTNKQNNLGRDYNMGKKVYAKDVPIEWAKLAEGNRDMGNSDGSDMANKIDSVQGQYLVDVMLTDEVEQQLKDDGIPHKGLQAQLFKQRATGEKFYKAKRGHFNPKFKDKETGEMGVVVGPPEVCKLIDPEGPRTRDNMVEWDWEEDGLIGNGSIATIKFDVWDGKITTLETVLITEHVPYESNGENF